MIRPTGIVRTVSADSCSSWQAVGQIIHSQSDRNIGDAAFSGKAEPGRYMKTGTLSAVSGVSCESFDLVRRGPESNATANLVYVKQPQDTFSDNEKRTTSTAPCLSATSVEHGRYEGLSDSMFSGVKFVCSFESSEAAAPVLVYSARPKGAERIREKLVEYKAEGASWPMTACILDPVRSSVVCCGPSHMLDVVKWFTSSSTVSHKLLPCRIKNKFAIKREETVCRAAFSISKP